MAGNGKRRVAMAAMVGVMVVGCVAMLAAGQCALRLTPGGEGGGDFSTPCAVKSWEGPSDVALLTECEGSCSPPAMDKGIEAPSVIASAEGELELTVAGQFSLKYGSYDGSSIFRRSVFFYP